MLYASGQKIKRHRERKGLTPEKVAGVLKMTVARYEAIERGANFTVLELARISQVLKVEPKHLLA